MSIYVKDADGSRKLIAGVGLPGSPGKSAYQYAVEGGFSGTEDEFRALMGVRSNDNLLDNWYFPDPINQRGQTEYTSFGYGIDRWLVENTSVITVEDDCISITSTAKEGIFQKLDATPMGKVLTLSVLVKEGNGLIFVSNHFETTEISGPGLYSVTIKNGLSTPLDCPYIRCASDGPLKVVAAKLELGPVQTLAHQDASGNWVLNDPPPNKTLELLKCQRYQVVVHSASAGIGHKFADNVLVNMILPVPLRGWPSVLYTGAKTSFYRDITSYHAVSNIALDTGSNHTTNILLNTKLADLEFGDVGDLFISADDYLILDANL